MRLRAGTVLLVWLASAVVFSCGGAGEPGDLSGYNLLLVTLDTTRADVLGCYGKEDAGTPNLDRLAQEGIVFDRAVAHAPITLPTHASILTGTYPPFHGVRGNGFYSLPDERITLAEILGDAGYRTGAVVAARVLDRRFGLAQGFACFDDDPRSMSRASNFTDYTRRAPAVNEAAIDIAADFSPDEPWFLWVHYFDPHHPYEPLPEFGASFPDTLEGRYQAEVATVDHYVGELLAELRRSGVLDRTLVVVTADHGEGILGPHAEKTHGIFVYEDTIHVPLIFHAGGALTGGQRRPEVVGQADILPTVLDLFGIRDEGEAQGRSLRAALSGASIESRATYAEAILPWYKFGWAPLLAVRDRRYKFIDAPTPELYDLEQDPLEATNLAPERADLVSRYRERIREVLAQSSGVEAFAEHLVTSEEEKEMLQALGYTSSGRRLPEGDELAALGDLKDPKDWAHVQDRIHEARGAYGRGDAGDARRILEEIVREDPANYEAYAILVQVLMEQGELDEAHERLEEMLAFRPDTSKIHMAFGQLERRRAEALRAGGDEAGAREAFGRALERMRRAVELEKYDTEPMIRLASLAFEAGRKDEAEEVLRRARSIDARDFQVNSMLGSLLVDRGETAGAMEVLEDALDAARGDRARERAARGMLVQAYLRASRLEEAQREVEWLERSFPGDPAVKRLRAALERAADLR